MNEGGVCLYSGSLMNAFFFIGASGGLPGGFREEIASVVWSTNVHFLDLPPPQNLEREARPGLLACGGALRAPPHASNLNYCALRGAVRTNV